MSKTIEELEAEIAALRAQEDALKAAESIPQAQPAQLVHYPENTSLPAVHPLTHNIPHAAVPTPQNVRMRPAAQTGPSAWPLEPYLRQAR